MEKVISNTKDKIDSLYEEIIAVDTAIENYNSKNSQQTKEELVEYKESLVKTLKGYIDNYFCIDNSCDDCLMEEECDGRICFKYWQQDMDTFDFYSTPNTIVDAVYVSVWDDGVAITSACKVNLATREVFDIEIIEPEIELDICENEYVVINRKDYPVVYKDEFDMLDDVKNIYWLD